MIAALIHWSIRNRVLVLAAAAVLAVWGVIALRQTPLDALPDLSDTQVIVRTRYPGQAPQVVEDQVTYPLTTTLLSVPHAKTVRGYSFYGDSFVYVLFEDGVDLYWARSRVLEALAQTQGRLPDAAKPELGPDATGVGWIYEYALVDRSGGHDLSQLRSLQDWFLRYELKTVPGVAEVATVGGMVRQYQIVLDPERLLAYGFSVDRVMQAVQAANGEAGGGVIELSEAEYMVRARGYLKTLDDFRAIPLGESRGTPILLADVATLQLGPEMRRGIAELDGEGEVVGGIVVLRSGENARRTIDAVKTRLEALQPSLPQGVELVTVYDRSQLIDRAVENLRGKLIEEVIVVAVVCTAFLFHLRSALVAVITLPLGVLAAFIVMRYQGIPANLMSLGGIAIAIGAMVDAAVVMIENAHKKLEHADAGRPRAAVIAEAAAEVGPALFFSLLIITLSFLPVFALEAQEGRLFAPLAYTKTYAMAAAAGLSVTLIPVLMTLLLRGRIKPENRNPLNRALVAAYLPALRLALRHPMAVLAIAAAIAVATLWPIMRLGSEFMPPLDEGDLLYMPSAAPGLSAAKAAQLLQQTDRILKTFPEVESVFGKAGRAESATDPAPLEMFETTLRLKPREQWREGMTPHKLVAEMDAALKIPGLGNVWVQPIRNRIDMLATGIKSPVGVKIAGPDLREIDRLAREIETLLREHLPGTASAFAERVSGGRYIEIDPDRIAAARYGLSIEDLQRVVRLAVGGENVGETVEGLARYPINLRFPRERRDSVAALRELPLVTPGGAAIALGSVARVDIVDGPSMIRSENARPSGWVYVDIRDRDLGSYVREARELVARELALPPGYSLSWSGQFEYLERAAKRLQLVIPATLLLILLLLYLSLRSAGDALLVMATLPFALVGGFWLIHALGHALSVASAIGFIALAGVAAEFGVVMLVYLQQAVKRRAAGGPLDDDALMDAIVEGAALRIRPKAMTVAVIVAGLIPLFVGQGAGSEVMQRIAAPMVGGMLSAPLLSLFVLPAAYRLLHGRRRT